MASEAVTGGGRTDGAAAAVGARVLAELARRGMGATDGEDRAILLPLLRVQSRAAVGERDVVEAQLAAAHHQRPRAGRVDHRARARQVASPHRSQALGSRPSPLHERRLRLLASMRHSMRHRPKR